MSAEEYIGVPGELVQSKDADLQGCKAGGLPWLWEELSRESLKEATRCEVCGAARSLILQVHAPLRDKSTDRVILLFVCTSDACCGAPHAFSAIRCQKQIKTHGADSGPIAVVSNTPQQDFYGGSTDSIDASSSSMARPAQGLDFSDLLADMDKLAVSNASPLPPAAVQEPAIQRHSKMPAAVPQPAIICPATAPVLPEFWIGFRRVDESHASASSDDAHIQRLLQEYQNDAAAAELPASIYGNGEHYEKTDPHTKFLERLSRHPTQCVRYGSGMQYLWPSEQPPEPGCCQHCGAVCVPELQVLSPMWHFMEETVTWYDGITFRAPDQLDTSVLSHCTWDWEAVLVSTCSLSCQKGSAAICIAQEHISAFNLASSPGQAGDVATVDRLNAALQSGPSLPDAEVVDAAAASAAAAEDEVGTIDIATEVLAPAE